MKTVRANAGFWIAGLLLALAGVSVARVVAPSLHGTTRLTVMLGGQFLALAGLFIICLGVRRRIKRAAPSPTGSPG